MRPTQRMRIRPRPERSPVVQKPSLWRVPVGWFKQESFYRDITTKAVSIAIVASIAYVYALAAGYVGTPRGLMNTYWALLGVILIVLVALMTLNRSHLIKYIVAVALPILFLLIVRMDMHVLHMTAGRRPPVWRIIVEGWYVTVPSLIAWVFAVGLVVQSAARRFRSRRAGGSADVS